LGILLCKTVYLAFGEASLASPYALALTGEAALALPDHSLVL